MGKMCKAYYQKHSVYTIYDVSGRLRVKMNDGTEEEFGPGDVDYLSACAVAVTCPEGSTTVTPPTRPTATCHHRNLVYEQLQGCMPIV
jgi:hypothetical protein